jgi:hypothetical protein
LLGQAFEHNGYNGEFGEALSNDGDGFVVGHQAAVAPEPGEGARDNPAAGLLVSSEFWPGALGTARATGG